MAATADGGSAGGSVGSAMETGLGSGGGVGGKGGSSGSHSCNNSSTSTTNNRGVLWWLLAKMRWLTAGVAATSGANNRENSWGSILRSRKEIVAHLKDERAILRKEWPVLLACLLFQYIHNVSTNLVYYLETDLSPCQRQPLYDLGFVLLPELPSELKIASEALFDASWVVFALAVVSVLFTRLRPPHGRKNYLTIILKRDMITLVALQALRMVSFSVTLLPGAARQCTPGSKYWDPPLTISEVFFRIDAVHGCGDLMFSSHTIFTMTILLTIFKYCNWPLAKGVALTVQVTLVPLILSARKHYTVDVFTALYASLLWWFAFEAKYPDPTDEEMRKKYHIYPFYDQEHERRRRGHSIHEHDDSFA